MRLDGFRRERAADWAALDALLRRAAGRPERLGADGVLELGRRYRAAAADLALARRLFPAEPLTRELEALVVRGRQAVYADAGGRRRSPVRFFADTYWQNVWSLRRPMLVAGVLFWGGIALAALWGASDPEAARGVVPGAFLDAADPPRGDQGLTAAESAAFSTEVLTNNIQVSFLVFAAGIVVAVGGAVVLLYNALVIGALFGVAQDAGTLDDVLRLVTSHGVLELTLIVVEAAAGLRFGWALVEPGDRSRRAALTAAARPAMEVVLGTIPWIVLAGLLEGFVSPAGASDATIIAVGFGAAALYVALLVWRGPRGSAAPSS